MIVFFVVALILIGIGIVIGLVGCGLAVMLIGLGMLSSSVLIGIRTKRPENAIRAFLIQCCVIGGIPAGAICALLLEQFSREIGNAWVVPMYGAIGGAVAGLVVALALDRISRWFHAWLMRKV